MLKDFNHSPLKKIRQIPPSLLIAVGVGLGMGIGTGNVVEGLAVGSGILTPIVLIYGDHNQHPSAQESSYLASAIFSGLIVGAGLGVVFGLLVGNLAFYSIGAGTGMCLGLAIDVAFKERNKGNG